MKARPLIPFLVESGLCADRKQAEAWLMAGKVLVNDQPARAGSLVKSADAVRLKEAPFPYASRGGLKLSGALYALGLNPQGLVCLDAGASTGGFTDCLLQQGASLVYAVDVGFGQLTGSLRQDARVVNLERTNLADPSLKALNPRPAFATCDLSYLSLRDAVPLYQQILDGQGTLVALVKPLFEVADPQARRSGRIPDGAYQPMLKELCDHLNAQPGTAVMGICPSPVTGSAGTIEFFLHIRFCGGAAQDLRQAIADSVAAALETQSPRKAGNNSLGPA